MMYDHHHNRWIVDIDNTAYGLDCGEKLELIIGSRRIPCRLELSAEWYLIMDDANLNLRPCETYKIEI